MLKLFIAYDITELEKKKVLSEAHTLYKQKVLSETQWLNIKNEYASKLETPSFFMKVLLFIVTYIGMITIIGPILLTTGISNENAFQFISVLLGLVFLLGTEYFLIKQKHHYKSGITEACIYAAILFISIGILGFDANNAFAYPTVLFLLTSFVAIRYLNRIALVAAPIFMGWILFTLLTSIGAYAEVLMPFVFMAVFGLLYMVAKKLQQKLANVILEDHFVIVKTLSLIIFYLAGNYFVVRELSIELMKLSLADNQDIPFAFLFYTFTAIIPLAYIYFGIKQRSLLLIRTGLLVITLSIVTFKYYFSLGMPAITVTVSGAILIVIALLLFKYLKHPKNGFTQQQLLQDKWASKDVSAIALSQTLGGTSTNTSDNNFGGGEFGGGGANTNW
ncbi:hypothetical protein N9901_00205 [Flavobacteriaceae bacterium]|nr:hypothetical protein [Flavobacteriaceae bacterium]